jgi:hypothetical protein
VTKKTIAKNLPPKIYLCVIYFLDADARGAGEWRPAIDPRASVHEQANSQGGRMDLMHLQIMASYLDVINPSGMENEDGNCGICAYHTAQVLTTDHVNPVQQGYQHPPSFGTSLISFPFGPNRALWSWSWMQMNAIRNGVYVLEDDEDHVFNMLRDENLQLYVIDSNMQIYRRVASLNDCVTRIGKKLFNHLGPGEGKLRVYYMGDLHPRWNTATPLG